MEFMNCESRIVLLNLAGDRPSATTSWAEAAAGADSDEDDDDDEPASAAAPRGLAAGLAAGLPQTGSRGTRAVVIADYVEPSYEAAMPVRKVRGLSSLTEPPSLFHTNS